MKKIYEYTDTVHKMGGGGGSMIFFYLKLLFSFEALN